MTGGVYIFTNKTAFLNAIAELEREYNSKPPIIYFTKNLNGWSDVKKEIYLLKNFKINGFQGFRSRKQIKVTVTDGDNCRYCVTYCFKNNNNEGAFGKFNRHLKRSQKIWI